METKELTPEELAALAEQERVEIIGRCKDGTKGLSEEDRAKVANDSRFLALCEAERQQAKDAMLARIAKEQS